MWIVGAWTCGLACFFLSFWWAMVRCKPEGRRPLASSLEGAEMAVVRRLVGGVKILAMGQAALALPLIYVAAWTENPVGNQDVTIVSKDRSWLFWYPRGASAVVVHGLLGPKVAAHYALRLAYAVCLMGAIGLDSTSCLVLSSQRRCIRTGKCDVPKGHSTGSIQLLVYRDLFALWLGCWSLFAMVYVAAIAGFFQARVDLDDVRRRRDRSQALRVEQARCGFLEDEEPRRHKAVFGIDGELNAARLARHPPSPRTWPLPDRYS